MSKNRGEIKITDVLTRLGLAIKATKDSEIAQALGVSRQVFSTWKARGTIPYDKIANYACQNGLSLDYLLFDIKSKEIKGVTTEELLVEVALYFFLASKSWPNDAGFLYWESRIENRNITPEEEKILTASVITDIELKMEEYLKDITLIGTIYRQALGIHDSEERLSCIIELARSHSPHHVMRHIKKSLMRMRKAGKEKLTSS
ncbi:MAG: helix-turn-helix domain-containing protein [Sedimenticola sp.]